MGRADIDPLDAREVSKNYEVTVWSPSNIKNLDPDDLKHLLGEGQSEWSGFTLRVGNRHLVVINTAQSTRRQNSVLMHELAHIILGHELGNGTITDGGHFVPSTYGQDQEDEAAWFGGTLLLPRPALLWMRTRGMNDDQAASHFGVSKDLLRWRVRMTGIDAQFGYRKKIL